MKKILELKNVSKTYKMYKTNFDRLKEIFLKKPYHREFISNDNISFDLYEGETLGIIGVNGAGKSTVLKIIAGVINQTSGEVIRHGRITALLELGTGFHDEASGYENIFLNGLLIGMSTSECEQKAQKIIDFSELGLYIHEPIKTYSSGMKMRLAFSIALYAQPQVLIVDEALSVGDAHFSAKCNRALQERKKDKLSIIYVSHDLNSLKLLCNRIILLHQGKVLEEGNPEKVINKYNYLIATLNESETYTIQKVTNNAFGTLSVEIETLQVIGEESLSSTISSGERATITLKIKANESRHHMTIGFMIRDRFGQDIFGTNTFHHHMNIDFEAHTDYICSFNMPLNLGTGHYTITAAIHSSVTHLEYCAHWIDHAINFEIAGIKGPLFGGITRLEPTIAFYKANS